MRALVTFLICFMVLASFSYANENELLQYEKVIKQHRGEVIYLDFWASWCTPCRKSFPWMNQMQEKYRDNHFKVISINVDSDPILAKEFLAANSADFTVLYDPQGALASQLKLKGMPSSFIINREGKIVRAHVGFSDRKKLKYEQEIKRIL